MRLNSPILNFICPLHIVNVHSDLVLDMMGKLHAARSDSSEHNTSPELPLIQQLHGLVDEPDFCCYRFELVQVDTLTEEEPSWELWWPRKHTAPKRDCPGRGVLTAWQFYPHPLIFSLVIFQYSTENRSFCFFNGNLREMLQVFRVKLLILIFADRKRLKQWSYLIFLCFLGHIQP